MKFIIYDITSSCNQVFHQVIIQPRDRNFVISYYYILVREASNFAKTRYESTK